MAARRRRVVRLLGLHPATLEVESAHPVASPLSRLVVAPDGERAYGLTEAGTFLVEVDLVTGATVRRAEFPRTGYAADLAVTDRWVYVANALGKEVWTVDRRRAASCARSGSARARWRSPNPRHRRPADRVVGPRASPPSPPLHPMERRAAWQGNPTRASASTQPRLLRYRFRQGGL